MLRRTLTSIVAAAFVLAVSAAAVAAAPVVITSPADDDAVSGIATITVQMQPPVTTVKVSIDGAPLGSTPPLSLSWNTTKVPNGVHHVEADGFNASNVFQGSSSIDVTVINGVPGPTGPIGPAGPTGRAVRLDPKEQRVRKDLRAQRAPAAPLVRGVPLAQAVWQGLAVWRVPRDRPVRLVLLVPAVRQVRRVPGEPPESGV